MGWKELTAGPKHLRIVVALLVAFVLAGTVHYTTDRGGDLGPSYIGCRLVASGEASHLYAYDPADFSEVGADSAWARIAAEAHVDGMLHPYVQTPLWASLLQPLCTRTDYRAFARVFAFLTMASFAAIIWLVGRRWTPALLNPYAVGLVLVLLYLSIPFRLAMLMLQTHVLFVLMVLAALMLAERRRPVAAGLLLACAAAVKITPGFLIVYWLLQRRWKAAASAVVWSALIWGATLAVDGRTLVTAYSANLQRISATLLITDLNQSFASWAMGRFHPALELSAFHTYPMPPAIRLVSTGLMLLCLLIGGLVDRQLREGQVPLGAMIALVGALVFSPIAWTHYFVILMVPLMLLVHENRAMRSVWVGVAVAGVVALNLSFAGDRTGVLGRYALSYGAFYSGLLCLALLGYASWRRWNESATVLAGG